MPTHILRRARILGLIHSGFSRVVDLAELSVELLDDGFSLSFGADFDSLEEEKTSFPDSAWVIVIDDLLGGFHPFFFSDFGFMDSFIKGMSRLLPLLAGNWIFR